MHLSKSALEEWLWALGWGVLLLVTTGLMVSRVPFPNVKRFLVGSRSPHLLMLGAALLIAAVYYYSEAVLLGLLVAYLAWTASFNLRARRTGRVRVTSGDGGET